MYRGRQFGDGRDYHPGIVQKYDYANWGYIILYLAVMLFSLVGNILFILTVKKNSILHKTPHYLLLTLSVRDLIVTLGVVPFVIDSQAVNLMQWNAGKIFCKLYSFLNHGTMAQHSFNLIFLLFFLYIWYRKQESYAGQDGNVITRNMKMHKWAIPLMWVLGLGLAIPAGAFAWDSINNITGSRMCSVYHGYGQDNHYWAQLSLSFGAFLIPVIFFIFPTVAMIMQVFGCREPKLDPPHNRTAITAIALVVIYLVTRCPAEIYQMTRLFHQSGAGLRMDSTWGTPRSYWNFEKEMILNCLIYIAPAIHPLLYFAINPIYRTGLKEVWKNLYCNKSDAERERDNSNKRRVRDPSHRIPQSRNRVPHGMRAGEAPLVDSRQPVIVPANKSNVGFYTPGTPHYPGHMSYEEQQTMKAIADGQQFHLDNSFDTHSPGAMTSPTLPPVFEYGGLKYIDTARVEPRIAYSPEKTPPKTPETPRYEHKPFMDPVEQFFQNNQWHQQVEMVDFTIPTLEDSPILGRSQSRHQDLDETVEILEESPGTKSRNRQKRQKEVGYTRSSEIIDC